MLVKLIASHRPVATTWIAVETVDIDENGGQFRVPSRTLLRLRGAMRI